MEESYENAAGQDTYTARSCGVCSRPRRHALVLYIMNQLAATRFLYLSLSNLQSSNKIYMVKYFLSPRL